MNVENTPEILVRARNILRSYELRVTYPESQEFINLRAETTKSFIYYIFEKQNIDDLVYIDRGVNNVRLPKRDDKTYFILVIYEKVLGVDHVYKYSN